ncbi:MAG: hypothetical protein IJ927_02035 [Eubacterium sp.]|nr:hypothetical protein [Eubacterium sp.]
MTAKKRIAALILAFAMVFAMAFSVFFIAHNSEHNCTGEDCHICRQISICLNSLKNLIPKPEKAQICIFAAFLLVLAIGIVEEAKKQSSLIDLKVKLSD